MDLGTDAVADGAARQHHLEPEGDQGAEGAEDRRAEQARAESEQAAAQAALVQQDHRSRHERGILEAPHVRR